MGKLSAVLTRFRAAACALVLWGAPAGPAQACQVALLLAVDVSSSVDSFEYGLQIEGHAAAFRDEAVIEAILFGGGVDVALLHWSGNPHQQLRTVWTRLDSRDAILAYADLLGSIRRRFDQFGTALGAALLHAGAVFDDKPRTCARRVLDISGDGISNTGPRVAGPRAALIARGVTINGLVITANDPTEDADQALYRFYRDEVVGGAGTFVELAVGFRDYARAFKRKLLIEIEPIVGSTPHPNQNKTARGPDSP